MHNWSANANDDDIIAEIDVPSNDVIRVIRPHVFTRRPPREVPKIKLIVIIAEKHILKKLYYIPCKN